MLTFIKSHPLQFAGSLLLLFVSLMVLMPTFSTIEFPLRWSVNYLELYILTLFLFGTGMFLMPRLTVPGLVALACSAIMCKVLKDTTDGTLVGTQAMAAGPGMVVRVATFNTNSIGSDVRADLKSVVETKPDVLLVQELHPGWDSFIESVLPSDFNRRHVRPSIGLNGLAVYSRYPMDRIREIDVEGCPVVYSRIRPPQSSQEFYILTAHPQPVLQSSDLPRLQRQLEKIHLVADSLNAPLLVGGDFNCVAWSNEMIGFRDALNLSDCRWGFSPTIEGGLNLWQPPMNHLMSSKDFTRLNFKRIARAGTNLGVFAELQLHHPTAPNTADAPTD